MEDSLGLGETLIYLGPDSGAADRLRFDAPQRKLVEGHLSRGNARATRILEANRAQLMALARELDAEGILQGEALDDLLSAVIAEEGGETAPLAPLASADAVAEQGTATPLTVDTVPGTGPSDAPSPATALDTSLTSRAPSDATGAEITVPQGGL
jgi:hypothetical protein